MPPAVATNPYPQFLAQEYFNSYSDQLGFDSYEEFADSLLEADPQTLEDMADYLHKDQFGHIKKEDFDERIGMNLYRDELEPDGFLESFWESLKYSTTQANPQMYGKAMEAAGILMGLDTVKDAGEWIANKAEGLDVGKAPEIELKDVDSSNFLQFLGESLGSGIGSTIPSIVSGVAGGAAGTAMGGPVGGAAGAIIGATITAAPMNMGEIYQQLVDEGIHKEDAALASLITNIPVTMLDVAGIERLLRVVPGSKVFKSKLMNNLSRAVTGAVQGSAAEGVTETGQSAIREAVAASMTDEPKVQERLLSVLHEGVVGAMTGGAIGGARGAVPEAATTPAVEPEVMPAEPEVIPETEMDVEPVDIEPEAVEPEATEIDDEFEIIPDEERSVESMTLEEEANAGKRKVLDPTTVKEGDRVVVDNPTGMPEEGTVSEATENIVRVMNDAGSPIGVIVPGQPDNPNLYEVIPDEKELEAQRKAEEEAIKEQKRRMAEEEKEEKKKQEEAEKEARKKQEEAEKEARKKAEEEEKAKKRQEEETKKREDDLNAWRGEAERAMNRLDTNPEDTVSLEALRKLRNDQRFNQLESDERDTVDDYLLMMEKRAESEKIREEAINKEPGTPERKAIDEKIERTDKVVSDIQDRLAGITETTHPDNKAKEDRYLSALENKKKVRDEYKKEIDSLNAGIVPKFIADSVSSGTSIEARGEAIKKEVQKVRFDYEMELDRAEKEITQLEEGLENLRNLDKEAQKEKKPKLKTPKEPKIAVPKPQKRPPRGVAFRDDRRGVNFTREEAKKILADAGIEVIETPGNTSDDLLVADEDWNKAFDLLDPEAAAVVKKMREKETGTATTPKGKIKALKKGDPGFDKMPPPDTIKTPAGNTHPVEHAIVDASQLVASNTFDGRINPAYPENLQPRHRDRVASESQISDIMNKLDPRELAPAYFSEFGPPVVDRDGNVEAGNGRAIALQTAYANPDKYPRIEQYRQWIKEQGYPIPEGVKNPVLVRLRTNNLSQEELLEFTRATNDERTQRLSSTEQAFVDAERMTDGMVQEHTGGDLTLKRNLPFVRRFLGAVVPKASHNEFMDSKGKLSQDGEKRMAAALLAKAYGNRRLVEQITEATDEGRATIRNVLIGISPAWSKMQDRIRQGTLHEDADITEALMDTANIFENFDIFRQDSKYKEWSAAGLMKLVLSPDLPGIERPYMVTGTKRNELAKAMVDMFYHEPRKTRKGQLKEYQKLRAKDKIIADLEAYLDKVSKFNPQQGGMFGDQIASAPDPIAILKEVKSVEPTKVDDIEVIEEKIDDEPAAGEPAALEEPPPDRFGTFESEDEYYKYLSKQYSHAWYKPAKRTEIVKELENIIKRMAPGVKLKAVPDTMVDPEGRPLYGLIDENEVGGLIAVSIGGGHKPQQTLSHEIIHSLRGAGLFTKAEWNKLRRAAVKNKWLEKHQIRETYPDYFKDGSPTETAIEEAIAEEFGEWSTTQGRASGLKDSQRLFQRIRDFFRQVINALRKLEVPVNPRNIFEDIDTGRVGSRRRTDEPEALREPGPQQLIRPDDDSDVGMELQGKLEAAAKAAGLQSQPWENDDGRIFRFRVWKRDNSDSELDFEVVEDREQDDFSIKGFLGGLSDQYLVGKVYVSKKHFENRDQKFWEQLLKNKYDEFLDLANAEREVSEAYSPRQGDEALEDVMYIGGTTAHELGYDIYEPDLFSGQGAHFVTIDERGNEITFRADTYSASLNEQHFDTPTLYQGRYKTTVYVRINDLLRLHHAKKDAQGGVRSSPEEAMQWWEKQIENAWSKMQPHLQEQARQAAEMEQVRAELSETLKKLAPNLKLGLEVRKSLGRAAGLYWGKGTKPAERSEPIGVDEDEINGLIQVAMESYHYSQEHILNHEAIHALRRNGLFTDAEWKTLRRTAVENKWLKKYDTEALYPHLFKDGTPTDEAFEEAIAQAFSYWATRPQDRAKLTGLEKVEGIFERIREFFRKLVAILRKYEVPINPYNLFEDIEAGIVGSRDWQNMKAVQQASAESTELRGPDPFYSQMMNVVRDAKVSEKGMKLQGWKELLTRQKSGIRKAELDDIAFGSLTRLLEGETRILSDLSLISISMNLGRIADANSRIKKEVMQEYLRRYQPKIEVVKYGGVDEGNVHSLARETGGIGWTGKDGKKISKDLIKAVFRTGAMFENNSVKNFFKENDNEISRTLEPPGKELLEKYDLPVDEDLPSIKQVLKVDVSRSYSGIFSIETYNVESEEYDHYESKFLHDVFHALNVSVGRTYFKKYQENSLFERGAKWEGWTHKGGYKDYQEIMVRSPEGFRYGEDKSYAHWDKNDVIAHFRASTRNINGKKTLFLEEVQSDIHQGTQKETRSLRNKIAELREELETHERGTEEGYKYYKDAGKNVPESLMKMREATRKQLEEGIKDQERILAESGQPGPFAKTEEWVRLALKQAMEIAAKEGHEAIAWATGVSESLMQKRYEFHGIEADEVKKGFVDDDVKFSEEQLDESTEYNLNQDRKYTRGLEKFYGQTIPSVLKKYFRQQGWQWAEKGGKDIAVVDFGPELYAEYIGISDTKYISQEDFEKQRKQEFDTKRNALERILFEFRKRLEVEKYLKDQHPKTVHMTKEDFEAYTYANLSERQAIEEKYRPKVEKIAQEYIDNWVDVNFTKVGPSKAFWVPVGKEVSASITEKGQPRYLAQSTDMPPILQDLEAEKRLKKAEEGIQPDTLTARIGEALTVMGRKFTRRYEHIDKTPENAEVIQRMLGLESEKHTAQDRVANILKRVSHGLNEGEQKTLTRYFVFQDLLWTAEQGMELPFGLPDLDSVALELRKLQSRIDSRPELKKRADIRQEELTKLKNQMVRHGVLRPEQARNPHYFRHQVLAYAKIRKMAGSGKKVSSTYWHTRRGSEKDINANYIQAEAEWMFKAYNDIATMKFINWIKQSKYDNKPNYVRMAKKQNTDNLNKWMDTDYLEKWVNPDKIEEFYNTDPAEQFEQIDELRQWLEDQGLEDWINFDLVEESAQNFDEWVGERDIRSWLDVDNLEKLLDKRKKEVAPYKELNKKIAMSMSGLAKALKQMPQSEWERIPEELRPHVQALMNRKRTMEQDHPIFGAIAWLAGQSHDPDVQMSALGFLGAVNRRKKFIKDVALKDSYIEPQSTKELIKHFGKEGEVAWQPDSYDGKTKAIHIFTGKSVPDHVADRMIDTLTESWEKLLEGNTDIDIPVEDFATFVQSIRDARMLGGPKLELIINDSLAETLNEFNDNEIANGFDWLARTITSRWRQWILFNPRRVSKYLLNNRTGDLDALLGNPSATGAVKYIPTAVKEMQRFYKDEKPSKLLIEAMDKGVVQTGLTMQEIQSAGELGTTPGGDITINPFSKSVTPVRWARKYFEKVRNFTRVLENGVRYAAYLHYRNQLVTQGKSLEDIGFGASPQWVLKGLNDPIDVAAVMARDALGDYGNLSVAGEWARKRLMAFPSWLESNTVRYVHLFKNAYLYGKHVSGKDGLRMGAITAASMFARIGLFYGLVQAWNNIFFGDEEEEMSPEERIRMHLHVGKWDDEIWTIRFQGALSDFLGWFGMEDAGAMLTEVQHGRASMGDVIKAVAKAPPNRIIQGVNPIYKVPVELGLGRQLYPDTFNPRSIRDPWQHFFRTFSMEHEYAAVSKALGRNVPSRGYGRSMLNALLYSRDPGEMAYDNFRNKAYEWLSNKKDRDVPARIDPRSTALYLYRKAVRFGDQRAIDIAKKGLREHNLLGKNILASKRRAHPLGMLSKRERREFFKTLGAKDRDQLTRATKWYRETYWGAKATK